MDKLAKENAQAFLTVYNDILTKGEVRKPRGQETLEILNYAFTINPMYPLVSFNARKLNIQYAVAELIWYLVGQRYDISICEFGSMWKSLIQSDGGLNSNYGQTIFGHNQFDWVVSELVRDPDSRRAVFIIGEKDYLRPDVNDQRCCQYIQFLIRNNTLSCYSYFRSSDAIWGMTNDVFTLVEIFKYVYLSIKMYKPTLKLGTYTQQATSFHIYEKHYQMLKDLLKEGMDGYYQVNIPMPTNPAEFVWLRQNGWKNPNVPPYFQYANVLLNYMK